MANKKAKGKRAKTRHKLSKKTGKLTINQLLAGLSAGQKVQIKINSSLHAGMPTRRFHGMVGVIEGRQGNAYRVNVSAGKKKEKVAIVTAGHLKVLG